MDQPGKVANPARGQLKQGKWIFPYPRGSCMRIWSRETGSAVPSRVSLLISILRLNMVLTYGIPPEFIYYDDCIIITIIVTSWGDVAEKLPQVNIFFEGYGRGFGLYIYSLSLP